LKLSGASSLEGMALCASAPVPGEELCCPLIDARRGEVYAALYRFSGDALERMTGDLVLPLTELVSRLDRSVVFVGGEIAAQAAATAAARGLVARHHAAIEGRGGWIAALGAARIARGDVDRIAALEPAYVRGPGIGVNQLRGTSEILEAVTDSGEKSNGTSRGRTDPALPDPRR
jgi:tRNA A37 threonylcarbamoyladenosine modification protein TsaB